MIQSFWWIEALFGVCLLLGAGYALKKIVYIIQNRGQGYLQKRLHQIAKPPLEVLIWTLVALYVIDVVGQRLGFSIAVGYLHTFRKAIVVSCLAWLLFRWKAEFQKSLLLEGPKKVDVTTVQVLGRLSTIGIIILATLVILQIFDLNTAPLLAFGSIGAASLGFAAKDVIANFCSGLMLQITRPFIIGDEILLPEKNLQGHVEEIGWFKTLVRDKEKRPVYFPNNLFATTLLINISRMTHRRVKQAIRLSFAAKDKIDAVTIKIHRLMEEHCKIDRHLPIHVHCRAFGEYAFELEIEAYCIETNQGAFNDIEQELILKIHDIMEEAQVSLAIPAMEIMSSKYSVYTGEARREQELQKR